MTHDLSSSQNVTTTSQIFYLCDNILNKFLKIGNISLNNLSLINKFKIELKN